MLHTRKLHPAGCLQSPMSDCLGRTFPKTIQNKGLSRSALRNQKIRVRGPGLFGVRSDSSAFFTVAHADVRMPWCSAAQSAAARRTRAFVSGFGQRGASPLRAGVLRPVTDCNRVAARPGGKQQEVKDRSVTRALTDVPGEHDSA